MNKEDRIIDMQTMYDSLMLPEKREAAKRNTERAQRIEDKKADYGV